MFCENCAKFLAIGNTKETGAGICSANESYSPANINDKCRYEPKPYTCGDCDRLGKDDACMTCISSDSAYRKYGLCGGFVDKQEVLVAEAFLDWKRRGYDISKKINKVMKEIDGYI